MKLRSALLTALAILLFSIPSFAQEQKTAPEKPKGPTVYISVVGKDVSDAGLLYLQTTIDTLNASGAKATPGKADVNAPNAFEIRMFIVKTDTKEVVAVVFLAHTRGQQFDDYLASVAFPLDAKASKETAYAILEGAADIWEQYVADKGTKPTVN
jgi:hypothetical protein